MREVFLVRHAQSYANKRDFAAFGNMDSPLTDKGRERAAALNGIFRERYGIIPEEYDKPVAVSEYARTQQTAEIAGFSRRDVVPLINESDVDREIMSGLDVINKHMKERWAPEEVRARTGQFIEQVQSGELDYDIFFTHGMFIASVALDCQVRVIDIDLPFDENRGFVPLQTGIVSLKI